MRDAPAHPFDPTSGVLRHVGAVPLARYRDLEPALDARLHALMRAATAKRSGIFEIRSDASDPRAWWAALVHLGAGHAAVLLQVAVGRRWFVLGPTAALHLEAAPDLLPRCCDEPLRVLLDAVDQRLAPLGRCGYALWDAWPGETDARFTAPVDRPALGSGRRPAGSGDRRELRGPAASPTPRRTESFQPIGQAEADSVH